MSVINETALKKRAKQLLVAMTQRDRYIYALSPKVDDRNTTAVIADLLSDRGIAQVADEADGRVVKYATDGGAQFIVFDNRELDIVFVEAAGSGVIPVMQEMLQRTGFIAQSKLLGVAIDVERDDAPRALRVLAHMAVAWDEDWTDLFVLHLASPDMVVRRSAIDALTLAAMVAQEFGPARELLAEAARREKMPKLAEVIADAERVVGAAAGDPVDLTAPS